MKYISKVVFMFLILFMLFPIVSSAWINELYGSFGHYRDNSTGSEYCHPSFEGVRMSNLSGLDVGFTDSYKGKKRVYYARENIVQVFKPDGLEDWEQDDARADMINSNTLLTNAPERPSSINGKDLGSGNSKASHLEPVRHPYGYDPNDPWGTYSAEYVGSATLYDCDGGSGDGHSLVRPNFVSTYFDLFNGNDSYRRGDVPEYSFEVSDERSSISITDSDFNDTRNDFNVSGNEGDFFVGVRLREIAEKSGVQVEYNNGYVYLTITEKPKVIGAEIDGETSPQLEVGGSGQVTLKGETYNPGKGAKFYVKALYDDGLGIEGYYSGSSEVGKVSGRDFGEEYQNTASYNASKEGTFEYEIHVIDSVDRKSYNTKNFTVKVESDGSGEPDLCPDGTEKPCDDPEPDLCPDGTEKPCDDPEPDLCPDGTEKPCDDPEPPTDSFEEPTAVCPSGDSAETDWSRSGRSNFMSAGVFGTKEYSVDVSSTRYILEGSETLDSSWEDGVTYYAIHTGSEELHKYVPDGSGGYESYVRTMEPCDVGEEGNSDEPVATCPSGISAETDWEEVGRGDYGNFIPGHEEYMVEDDASKYYTVGDPTLSSDWDSSTVYYDTRDDGQTAVKFVPLGGGDHAFYERNLTECGEEGAEIPSGFDEPKAVCPSGKNIETDWVLMEEDYDVDKLNKQVYDGRLDPIDYTYPYENSEKYFVHPMSGTYSVPYEPDNDFYPGSVRYIHGKDLQGRSVITKYIVYEDENDTRVDIYRKTMVDDCEDTEVDVEDLCPGGVGRWEKKRDISLISAFSRRATEYTYVPERDVFILTGRMIDDIEVARNREVTYVIKTSYDNYSYAPSGPDYIYKEVRSGGEDHGLYSMSVEDCDKEPLEEPDPEPEPELCEDGTEPPCIIDDLPVPDPGTGSASGDASCSEPSGNGSIDFDENDTDGPTRDWSQNPVSIAMSLVGYETAYDIDCTMDVEWSVTDYTKKSETTCTGEGESRSCTTSYWWETSSDSEDWSYDYKSSWELGDRPIDITSDSEKGNVSFNNSFNNGAVVSINDETYRLELDGETQVDDWVNEGENSSTANSDKPSSCRTSAPGSANEGSPSSVCVYTTTAVPSMEPSDAPDVTWEGNSGEYNVDLEDIEPVEVNPKSKDWTNRDFTIGTSLGENFSGIYERGSTYDFNNIAKEYSGNEVDGEYRDDGETETLDRAVNINVKEDGIYELIVESEDYAGYTTGEDTYREYKLDKTDPYEAEFGKETGKCEYKTIPGTGRTGFDCIADSSNELTVKIGDNLSGVEKTEFSWSKSSSNATTGGWGWNNLPVGTEEDEYHNGVGYDKEEIDIKVHSRTRHNSAVTDYNQLKEGLWYLHIRQEDRAGNIEETVSDPIFINKIKNLRIVEVTDPTWEDVFYDTDGSKKPARIQGIYPEWMPVYSNFENKPVKLGYRVKYRMDIVGFNGSGDRVDVDFNYHAMDRTNKIYKDANVYVEGDNSGKYIPLANSRYADSALSYDISPSTGSSYEDRLIRNEDDSSYNRGYNYYDNSNYRNAYRTVHREIYLPPTAKVVKRGESLDLVNENDIDYRLIVGQLIKGNRSGVGSLDYTAMEDKWSDNDNFGNGMNSIYGKNRPTYMNLNGKGGSNGSLFWYQLDRTALDDIEGSRPY